MQHKFWFSYLAFVLLLSGVAYVAISDDTDVPLALSDSEMAVLQATGINEDCKSHIPGCSNSTCDSSYYFGSDQESRYLSRCVSGHPGHNCTTGGARKKDKCLYTYYVNHCNTQYGTYLERDYECH